MVTFNIQWTTICNPWWWWVGIGTAKSGIAMGIAAQHVSYVFLFHVRRTTVGGQPDWQLGLFIQEQAAQRVLGRGSAEGDGGGISYGSWDTVTVHTEVAVNFRYYGDIGGGNQCIAFEAQAYQY